MPDLNRQAGAQGYGRPAADRRSYHGDHHRRRHGISYPAPYVYAYNTYLAPNFVGYPFGFGSSFDFDDDGGGYSQYDRQEQPEQNQGPAQQPGAYAEEAPGEEAQQPLSPLAGPENDESRQPSLSYRPEYRGAVNDQVRPQPATTLIFNDGRPSQQVHNYLLTSTTLYTLDDVRMEIPLSAIDVPATAATNRSAGVEFAPPASRKSIFPNGVR